MQSEAGEQGSATVQICWVVVVVVVVDAIALVVDTVVLLRLPSVATTARVAAKVSTGSSCNMAAK